MILKGLRDAIVVLGAAVLGPSLAGAGSDVSDPGWLSDARLEAEGARIGAIVIRDLPIFDPAQRSEKKAVYRIADRTHIDTRESVIQSHLLFRPGDAYSRRLLDETERNLRRLRFIREPEIRILGCHDGLVDLEVVVHEVWTTNPGVSFGRSGGENSSGVSLEELNVLGFGKQLFFDYTDDVDRRSYTARWHDPDVFGSRWTSAISLRDSDDGTAQSVELERPFYSLDARWSVGGAMERAATIEHVYRLGEPIAGYARKYDVSELSFGWSKGLRDGWVRRWFAGYRQDRAAFSTAADESAPAALPADRALDRLFLRFEVIEDDFSTARNRDQIARTEDFHFGLRYAVELGWAAPAFGADRDSALLRAEASRGLRLGGDSSLFLDAAARARLEGGSAADSLISAGIRYYVPTGSKGTFYATLSAEAGHALDPDGELSLGGDTGLRGYPLRYQAGSSHALLTLEQRFYSNRSLWRLADIGGAVFFDMGRSWGGSAFGPTQNLGVLRDVGIGLRFGSRKTALANVLHVDIAFPLDGPPSLERTQLLVQTKRSF